MNVVAELEEVWVATLDDQPGELAEKLAALAESGADLDFVIARRCRETPRTGVVFVTPIRGEREVEAARAEGFSVSTHLHSVRVEGMNEPGLAADVTRRVKAAGLNLRGFSAAVIGRKFVLHLAFETAEAAQKAVLALEGAFEPVAA